MLTETQSPNQAEVVPDKNLLDQYRNAQKEISQLMRARDPKGGVEGMMEVLSHLHDPQYFAKKREMFGDAVVQKFAELEQLQKQLDAKGLKAPTMEELSL
jgi:hypothetical protein